LLKSQLCNFINYDEAKKLDFVSLEWAKIAREMQSRSRDDCRNLWYNQVFNTIATGNDFTEEEDETLINDILEQDTIIESQINFDEITNGRYLFL